MSVALRFLLAVMVVGALVVSGCAKNPHLAGGILYLSQQNYEKAVRELETAVEQEPNNGLAHLKLAMAYAEIGETKKAGAEFDRALELDPKLAKDVDSNRKHYWVEHFNEGVRLSQEDKNFEEAAREFEKAIDLDPEDVRAYTNLGFCYTQMGDHEKALELFEKAASLEPTDETSRRNLAGIYEDIGKNHFKSGNYTEAIRFYQKALNLEPDRINCVFQLGICYFQKASSETTEALARSDYENALELYGRVLEQEPDEVDVIFNMGIANLALDNLDEAMNLLRRAVDIDPRVPEFHKILGRAYARAELQELAVTELVISKALNPDRGRRMTDIDSWISLEAVKARYGDEGDVMKLLAELGKPDEIYSYEESESIVEVWFYWAKGTGVYFVNGKTPPENRVSFLPKER
ncbi:MAG: tetratricopeptide repeat protein [Candidatus Eiseniibacteriota bacterium]|nr:MAG: tetratricopeptide repeat protein [Candidatus Eisenbacteria bacterium]